MSNTATATARLEARITPDLHKMLKRAAELQGSTVSQFVITAAQKAAVQTIEEVEVIRLSLADQECFAEALLNPPPMNDALKRAFKRHEEFLGAE